MSTPRKRTRQTKNAPPTPSVTPQPPSESVSALVETIKHLQEEKLALTSQLDDVHIQLNALRDRDSRRQSGDGVVCDSVTLTNGGSTVLNGHVNGLVDSTSSHGQCCTHSQEVVILLLLFSHLNKL